MQLGVYDKPDVFCLPKKLYGRKQEMQILQEAFNMVEQGGKVMVINFHGYILFYFNFLLFFNFLNYILN